MEKEILEAKRRLYSLLLSKSKADINALTENETELMFRLSTDEQIQYFLETLNKN
jgi:hypothetical protein